MKDLILDIEDKKQDLMKDTETRMKVLDWLADQSNHSVVKDFETSSKELENILVDVNRTYEIVKEEDQTDIG